MDDFFTDFFAVAFLTDFLAGLAAAFLLDFLTDFFAVFLAAFFTDLAGCDFLLTGRALTLFLAALAVDFFEAVFFLDLEELPPKAEAQPSEYFSFVPTRRIVIVSIGSVRDRCGLDWGRRG